MGSGRLSIGACVVLVALVGGCTADSSTSGSGGGTSARSPARPTAAAPPAVKDGHFTFTVLLLQCGLTAVSGSHSEGPPEGQFCKTRLRVLNEDAESHVYVARRQLLAGVTGRSAAPASFPMAVRRQLDEVPVGGHDLIEVEVWFDVPKDAHVTGVRVGGDRDRLGFMDSSTVPYVRGGALIPVTPTA